MTIMDFLRRRRLNGPVRDAVSFLVLALTVVTGYLALTVEGESQVPLRVVAALTLLVFLVRITQELLLDRVRDLRAQLLATQEEFARFRAGDAAQRDAIARLVDRQSSFYAETLDLTLFVGLAAADDRVEEVRVTTPTPPPLFYRTMRLAVPRRSVVPLGLADLDVVAREAAPGGVHFTVLPLVESIHSVRALVLLEPAVDGPLTWRLSYRPTGLWDDLRANEVDYFAWDARTPAGRSVDQTLTSFTVRFVFPAGTSSISVRERNSAGRVTREQHPQGPVVVWSDPNPRGIRYEWDITTSHS